MMDTKLVERSRQSTIHAAKSAIVLPDLEARASNSNPCVPDADYQFEPILTLFGCCKRTHACRRQFVVNRLYPAQTCIKRKRRLDAGTRRCRASLRLFRLPNDPF